MSQVHPQARTSPRTRTEIRCSTESTTCLAERYNITRATARKWQTRDDAADRSHRAHRAHDLGTTLSAEQEAIALHIRKLCLVPLDDLLNITQRFFNAKASRLGVSRLLRREGMAKLSDLQPIEPGQDKPKKSSKDYAPGFVHIDIRYLPQMPNENSRC